MPNRKGFTLMECLITMAISVIVLSFSSIYLSEWLQRQQLLTATESVMSYLYQKRAMAFVSNEDMTIQIHDIKEGSCFKVSGQSKVCELVVEDIQVTTDNRVAEIHFYGKRNTAQPVTLSLFNASGVNKIILSSLGRVRACDETGQHRRLPQC